MYLYLVDYQSGINNMVPMLKFLQALASRPNWGSKKLIKKVKEANLDVKKTQIGRYKPHKIIPLINRYVKKYPNIEKYLYLTCSHKRNLNVCATCVFSKYSIIGKIELSAANIRKHEELYGHLVCKDFVKLTAENMEETRKIFEIPEDEEEDKDGENIR